MSEKKKEPKKVRASVLARFFLSKELNGTIIACSQEEILTRGCQLTW